MISIKTLQSLEYDKILYSVSKFAVLKETKKYLLNFKPETDYDTVKYLLDKTQEAYKLLYTHGVNCIEFFDEMYDETDRARKGGVLPTDALEGDDVISRLLALCDEANSKDIDLEEALYQRLEEIISNVKEKESNNEN